MKKYMVIIMLLAILVSVTGCSSNTGTTSNTGSIDENQPYSAQGESYSVAINEAPETFFIDDNTQIPSSYPIYTNEYAYGQEGPLFEINDEVTCIMTNNLSQFLVLLYGETEAENCDIVKHPKVTHQVVYDDGKSEMWSSINGISIITGEYSLAQDVTIKSLNDNELLKAAVEYLDIKDPQIISTIEYDTNGKPYEYQYKITERTDNLFTRILNNSFSYVTVTYNPDSVEALLQICKVDMPNKYGDFKIVSYDTALEYIKENYPDIDASNSKAEIYYSSTIQPGYYIPCYRFYLSEAEISAKNDMTQYSVVDITMTDKE